MFLRSCFLCRRGTSSYKRRLSPRNKRQQSRDALADALCVFLHSGSSYDRVQARRQLNSVALDLRRDSLEDTAVFCCPCLQLIHPSNPPPAGFRCWHRYYRPDGWVGLQPVELISLTLSSSLSNSGTGGGGKEGAVFDEANTGPPVSSEEKSEAVVKALLGPDLRSSVNPQSSEQLVSLDELFSDAVVGELERHSQNRKAHPTRAHFGGSETSGSRAVCQ